MPLLLRSILLKIKSHYAQESPSDNHILAPEDGNLLTEKSPQRWLNDKFSSLSSGVYFRLEDFLKENLGVNSHALKLITQFFW